MFQKFPARASALFLPFGFLLLPFCSFSQDYLGFANSVYAGVNGIDVNPASIVSSPRKWDVTVFGANVGAANNYLGLQKRSLEHTGTFKSGEYSFPAFYDHDLGIEFVRQLHKKCGRPGMQAFLIHDRDFFFDFGHIPF